MTDEVKSRVFIVGEAASALPEILAGSHDVIRIVSDKRSSNLGDNLERRLLAIMGPPSAPAPSTFTFTIDTENTSAGSTASDHFKLPLVSTGTYDFNVDWGDDSNDDIAAYDAAEIDHTYSVAGEYTVTITGTIAGWRFNNTGDRLKMLDVSSWGPFTISGTTDGAFYGCTNLTSSASDAPLLSSGATNLLNTFRGCSAFNADLSGWDVSLVTKFQGTFQDATIFNADLSGWDVSSGTNFQGTFYECPAFNADLSAWDVSIGTNFLAMFYKCAAFNADLSGWDVSAGTNFTSFLQGANALSTANYDAILIGWAALDLVDGLSCHFGDAKYSAGAAATARAAIIADDNWTITDGGQV